MIPLFNIRRVLRLEDQRVIQLAVTYVLFHLPLGHFLLQPFQLLLGLKPLLICHLRLLFQPHDVIAKLVGLVTDLVPQLPDFVVHVGLHLLCDLDRDFGLNSFDLNLTLRTKVWRLARWRFGWLDWRRGVAPVLYVLLGHDKVLLVERLQVLKLLLTLLILTLVLLFELTTLFFEPCFLHPLF
jgi:hypothetical protein